MHLATRLMHSSQATTSGFIAVRFLSNKCNLAQKHSTEEFRAAAPETTNECSFEL